MTFTRRAIWDSDNPNTFSSLARPAGRMAESASMAAGVMVTTAPWSSVLERTLVMQAELSSWPIRVEHSVRRLMQPFFVYTIRIADEHRQLTDDREFSSETGNRCEAGGGLLAMGREYQADLRYEWDENKRAETMRERGIDFASMDYFDWETAIHHRSNRDGEERWSSFGLIGARLHHVIWMERGERIRIISLRKANARETAKYVEATT